MKDLELRRAKMLLPLEVRRIQINALNAYLTCPTIDIMSKVRGIDDFYYTLDFYIWHLVMVEIIRNTPL
jgi:hypothetical protein